MLSADIISLAFVAYISISLPSLFPRYPDHGDASPVKDRTNGRGGARGFLAEMGQVGLDRVNRRFNYER